MGRGRRKGAVWWGRGGGATGGRGGGVGVRVGCILRRHDGLVGQNPEAGRRGGARGRGGVPAGGRHVVFATTAASTVMPRGRTRRFRLVVHGDITLYFTTIPELARCGRRNECFAKINASEPVNNLHSPSTTLAPSEVAAPSHNLPKNGSIKRSDCTPPYDERAAIRALLGLYCAFFSRRSTCSVSGRRRATHCASTSCERATQAERGGWYVHLHTLYLQLKPGARPAVPCLCAPLPNLQSLACVGRVGRRCLTSGETQMPCPCGNLLHLPRGGRMRSRKKFV